MLKGIFCVLTFSVTFLLPQPGLSSTGPSFAKITNVNVKRSASGVALDLAFDHPVPSKSLKLGFERNFVQIVLKGAKIDAAKIQQVADSEVQKVFTYPYNNDTSRVRLILKHDNTWAKGKITLWNNGPKSVRIFLKDPIEKNQIGKMEQPSQVTLARSKGEKPNSSPSPAPQLTKAPVTEQVSGKISADDKAILKDVMNNTRDIDINNPDSVKAALKTTPLSAVEKINSDDKVGSVGIKADPTRHFVRMAIALFLVVGLFLGGALFVKRYAGKLKKLPFGKKERLIQVVATHYLGNKKSISLVKVTGEYMVVGVSNDGISLISKLGAEVNVDRYLDERFWGGTFEKHLDSYAKDKNLAKEIDLSESSDVLPELADLQGVKKKPAKFLFDGATDLGAKSSRIESAQMTTEKVELSAVRASIKEKLTKLKPLA